MVSFHTFKLIDMIKILLQMLQMNFLLGFIESGIFPSQLTEEEENRAIEELFARETHEEARKKLILHNLRLVGHIAKKYESKEDSYDDLISIGTIGLIKAVDTYAPTKQVKIATYASKCIENEILMVLRSNKKHSRNVLLSDAVGQDKDGEDILLEDIVHIEEQSTSDDFDKNEKLKALSQYLGVLDDKEYQIISLRYGLNGNSEYTQKEIGKMYRISRSYVSRIEKRALVKLFQEFKKNHRAD